MPRELNVEDWGLVDYKAAVDRQLETLNQVFEDRKTDTLIFCLHPSVVTLGRGTQSEDVVDWRGEVVETSRGGRATYHGPGQQVIYPIVRLQKKDVHQYLRQLEKAIVKSLAEFDVKSEVRTHEVTDREGHKLNVTGVWVNDKKVAAIGIAVKKWITYHGVAINLEKDKKAFTGIKPCGFTSEQVTSVEEVLGHSVDRAKFKEVAAHTLSQVLVGV